MAAKSLAICSAFPVADPYRINRGDDDLRFLSSVCNISGFGGCCGFDFCGVDSGTFSSLSFFDSSFGTEIFFSAIVSAFLSPLHKEEDEFDDELHAVATMGKIDAVQGSTTSSNPVASSAHAKA